jgi:hypothetical protein
MIRAPLARPTFRFLAPLVVAGCTTFTGSADDPVERSLTWFSYVAGDDIKAACGSGGPDRFRFVYNAVYDRQVRAYDLRFEAAGGATLDARARNRPGNLARFQLTNPLGPWELERSEASLTNEQADGIVTALKADEGTAPPSAGRQVKSNEFYWIVAACETGRFRLQLFEAERTDLAALVFARALLADDDTGIAFAPSRRVEGFDENAFYIKINANADGIVGRL